MSSNTTVAIRDLSKTYRISKNGSGRSLFRRNTQEVRALHPMSLVAEAGESIGVLGKNGSGKSTLLRIIAGSETPTTGEVLVSETPTLLGVSAALQRQLSGRQNIQLGLYAMGLTPKEVQQLEPGIIEWAELKDAIDRPLNTYSSGMTARLKFSIATAVSAKILLVDEALSTGDSSFTDKAQKRMQEFIQSAGTVFLVSHGAKVIQEHCSRAIWIHEGQLIADGSPNAIVKLYRSWSRSVSSGNKERALEVLQYTASKFSPVEIVFDSEIIKHLDGGRHRLR